MIFSFFFLLLHYFPLSKFNANDFSKISSSDKSLFQSYVAKPASSRRLWAAEILIANREKLEARKIRRTCQSLKYLPERILADDFSLGELKQINPPYFDVLSCRGCAGKCPFRDSEITTDPVLIVSIMHIRNPFKSFCQTCPNLLLPGVPIATRFGASWHVEDAVICEIAHDGIEVVAIERFQEFLQQFDSYKFWH
jgi:hypothetical protein